MFLTDKNITFVFDGFFLISNLFGCYKNENLISSYLLDKVLIKPYSKYFMLIVRSYTHYLFEKYCIIISKFLILISNEQTNKYDNIKKGYLVLITDTILSWKDTDNMIN